MYVAGSRQGGPGTMIQVVDIPDPEGELRLGASIHVDGLAKNRWQMDEYDGVLRIVTQLAWATEPPVLQTFRIVSSDEIEPVGSPTLALPFHERIESFNIGNRDEPTRTASMKVVHQVTRVLPVGEHLVRVVRGGTFGKLSFEIVRKDAANAFEPLASLAFLADLFEEELLSRLAVPSQNRLHLLAHGHHVYVIAPLSKERTGLAVVDLRNPSAPRVLANKTYPFRLPMKGTGQREYSTVVEAGAAIVQLGSTIAIVNSPLDFFRNERFKSNLYVLDLSNPNDPGLVTLELPIAVGRTELQAYGDIVMFGRWEPSEVLRKVRFYLERVDLSNPKQPKLLPSINVPGSILSYEPETKRLLTVDYRCATATKTVTRHECRTSYGWNVEFDSEKGTSTVIHRSLELLDLDGDNAVRIECSICGDQGTLLLVGGTRSGAIGVVDNVPAHGFLLTTARGRRRVFTDGYAGGVGDIESMDQPRWLKLELLAGDPDDHAFVVVGDAGVQTLDLPR